MVMLVGAPAEEYVVVMVVMPGAANAAVTLNATAPTTVANPLSDIFMTIRDPL
jgi:hypothetical protein